MSLFRSDLFRLVKEKSLYILAAIVALFALLKCLTIDMMVGEDGTYLLGDAILQSIGLDILGTIVAIGISFYNGKEFANKTIRNKICCGESRYKIFFVKLIINWMLAVLFFIISVATTAIAGGILFDNTLGEEFWEKTFCQLALLIGFSSIITCVVNVTKSMKASLILSVALFVFLNAFSYMLPQMGDDQVVKIACQSIYMVVSTMLMSSTEGVYEITKREFVNGEMISTVITYDNMYLNCILIGVVYTAVAVAVSLIVIRKQDYK